MVIAQFKMTKWVRLVIFLNADPPLPEATEERTREAKSVPSQKSAKKRKKPEKTVFWLVEVLEDRRDTPSPNSVERVPV